ncbi:DUF6630 family protein [Pasteurella multocida]|uniref:DUF6630 family protein n=1 Tax=Pasteurella multocida TaxID=747 RepID=UPI0023415145|nr:hypothetical protein [Pasteurella multocida]MDC4236522.1 hypothetical protein [Pasteurella multocida]
MNSELKQDLTELLRLSLVDDEFIDQYIDDITALFEVQGEWADGYLYWQEKGILPEDPEHQYYDEYFDWDENAFVVDGNSYPSLSLADILEQQALSKLTDWKFDAKELEYAVNSMLTNKIKIQCPEETYNDALYPYVQQALAPQNYTLCNYWNGNDSCLFMIFSFEEYERIREIASKWNISICAVDIE